MEKLFAPIKKIFEEKYSLFLSKVKEIMVPENDAGGGLTKGKEIVEKIATPTSIPVSMPKTPTVSRPSEAMQR